MKTKIMTLSILIVILFSSCSESPEKARKKLGEMGVSYNKDSFVNCVNENDIYAVKLFLSSGIDPNSENNKGQSALLVSLEKGHIDIIKVLLNAGANANEVLFNSIIKNKEDYVKKLLEAGIDVNIKFGANYWTREILNFIIGNMGLNLNFEIGDGYTPLMVATVVSNAELVNTLLKFGADVNLSDVNGQTALLIAEKNDYNQDIIKLLKEAGAN